MKRACVYLLAAAMALGAGVDVEARAQQPAPQPGNEAGAAGPSEDESQTLVSPGAAVEEDNEAVLELKVGASPRDLLFEEVKHSAGGAPLTETDVRYGANGKASLRMVTRLDARGRLLSHEFSDGSGKILTRSRGVADANKPFVVRAWAANPTRNSKPAKPAAKPARLTRLEASGVVLATYTYDPAGRLSKSLHPLPEGLEGASVEYSYDAGGRPSRKVLRLARGITATALYDARGKRREMKIAKPSEGAIEIAYGYGRRGLLSRADMRAVSAEGDAQSMRAEFLYDKAGRFQEQQVRSAGALQMRVVTARDAAGKMNGSTMYAYRDGKPSGSTTMRSLDGKTIETTQLDASGKVIVRQVFTDPKLGRPSILLRQEEVMADGFKVVTTFDQSGQKSGEAWFNPDGKPVPKQAASAGGTAK